MSLAVAAIAVVTAACGSSAKPRDRAEAATPGSAATASAIPSAATSASASASSAAPAASASPTASADPSASRPPAKSAGATPSTPATRKPATNAGKASTPPGRNTPADGPVGANPTVAGGSSSSRAVSDAEAMSLELLNVERARVGLAPVRRASDLDDFARKWAEYMRRTGFAHSGREVDVLVKGARTGVSENIVWFSDGSMTARQAAEKFQDMWRHSPGHYRNQTDRSHTEVGIGLYRDESGWWGVHEFANG